MTKTSGADDYAKVKDAVVGLAAAGAHAAGWDTGKAALLGSKAQEGAMSRIAAGDSVEQALSEAVIEAELIVMLDLFSKALEERFDPFAAFERALEVKRKTMADAHFAAATFQAADTAFRDALKGDLSPHAAFVSAYVAAASVARMAMAQKH